MVLVSGWTVSASVTLGAVGFSSTTSGRLTGTTPTAANSYSMCGWFYITTPQVGSDVVPFGISDGAGSYHRFVVNNGNGLDLRYGSNVGGFPVQTLSTATWYYLALSADASFNISAYIGGASGALTKFTGAGLSGWTPAFSNFAGDENFGSSIVGRLSNMKVWNGQLSDAQIAAERAALPIVTAGLVGHWKLQTGPTVLVATTGTNLASPDGGSWTTQIGPTL